MSIFYFALKYFSDYKIKYDGFDPKSPESVMGISIMQEENIQQSIDKQ